MIGLSALGLRWSQLQWLVAALGVGIGFGRQEIVANFISGLIIFFERPIAGAIMVTALVLMVLPLVAALRKKFFQ